MFNLYFIDNFGTIYLERRTKNIKPILEEIEKNYQNYLDQDTNRRIIITSKTIKGAIK